jgi:lipopolysaccharide/colanic/teichoic acid biosynthesis glycosyltransferase
MKFRTMRHDAETSGSVWATPDDPRATRIGRFLRRSRLDELPQLIDILKGEMSLVGPRPERPEFVQPLSTLIPFYAERHLIKPGLTGWAQIRHGYVNDVDGFEEKLALDLYYMKYRSFVMDLLILWKTAKTMVLLHGV